MIGESLQWLEQQVSAVSFDEKKFRISLGNGKYIFGAVLANSSVKNKPDYFAISSIYDTIIDLNEKIKYSFYMAISCEPSESLEDHVWFGKPQDNEITAIYYIENMVFRTAIMWDMLAQLYNELWLIGKPKPFVLKSLILRTLIFSSLILSYAFLKKSLVVFAF